MGKLTLDLDSLTVVTFEPGSPEGTNQVQSVTTPFYATTDGPGFCAGACW